MRAIAAALATAALVGLSTQTTVADLPFAVDISSVEVAEINTWCAGQINVCDTLCDEQTDKNSCLPNPPNWECLCASNSSAPAAELYTTSMQSMLCQQAFGQCQAQNAGDAEAQKSECVEGIRSQCGTLNIGDYDAGEDSTTTTATATARSSPTSPGNNNNATPSSDDADVPDAASVPMLAAGSLAAVVFALFANLL